MSKLLLDEHPLLVMPMLAKRIGLNESIVLQQIHYWNGINKKTKNNLREGHYWTFNSVKNWQKQFPFWSINTIQRILSKLEGMKLIVVGNYNKLQIDRTKWYRINYDVLEALEESPFTQIGATNLPKWLDHLASLGLPLPETNSEINSETKVKRYTIHENGDYLLDLYNSYYIDKFGKEHPSVTKEQLDDITDKINDLEGMYDIDREDVEDLIEYHFNNLGKKNDGKIFAFLEGDDFEGVIRRYLIDEMA